MEYIIFIISFLASWWLVKRKNILGISTLMGSLAGLILLLLGISMQNCILVVVTLIAVIDIYVIALRKKKKAFVDYRFF